MSPRMMDTLLWWAAVGNGRLDVIKWWVASRREIDLGNLENEETDSIEMAKRYGYSDVVTLLERFQGDSAKTRHQVRIELGWYDPAAAEMFALAVFVSDGLLRIKDTLTTIPAARYFNIAAQLPLELQMV